MKNTKRLLALLLTLILCLSLTAPAAAEPADMETAASVKAENVRKRELPKSEDPLPDPEQTVRVIVRMEGLPRADADPAVRALVGARIAVQHETLRRSLAGAGVAYTERFEYSSLLNGMALDLAFGDLEKLEALPGVRSVHIANRYAPPETVCMESSNEMTGAVRLHEGGITGAGTVIAVLDTGVSPEHEAFGVYADRLSAAKLSEEQVQNRIDSLGYGVWLSEKIPFAYNYYDLDDDVSDDLFGHGTHVSGIAAGYARTPEGELRFCGTAPDAQILAMKIFSSRENGGTDSSVYFKALEDAYLLGADVINLSIGAQNGFSYDRVLEDELFGDIYRILRDHGVSVSAAAGNESSMANGASNRAGSGYVTADYADYGVLSSPASYGDNIAVASAENAEYLIRVLEAGGRQIPILDADDQFFGAFDEDETRSWEYTVVPGYGLPEDYQGLMIEGRIALVSRGEISFQEKLVNAWQAGALGLLVYNNEPGEFYMSIQNYLLPAAGVSQADGEWLIALAQTQTPPDPEPYDESAEDLGNCYVRVEDQAQLKGGFYLIVNETASEVFAPARLSEEKNSLPAQITGGLIWATDALRLAELQLTQSQAQHGLLGYGDNYLSCSGSADEVLLIESPEDLTISIQDDNSAEIRCKNCGFRYDPSGGFRFYRPGSSQLQNSAASVALYQRSRLTDYLPTRIGSLRFPREMVSVENPRGWRMSEFSSMGVTPDLKLKPSLTGVGGLVCSAAAGTENGYEVWSGSSMAAPNFSGAIACVFQSLAQTRPELTGRARLELAEALLESSARILTDEAGRIYSPRKQGAGLIDLEAAASARALITDPLLCLGDGESGSFALEFTVQSLTDTTLVYGVDLAVLRDIIVELDTDGDGSPDGSYNSLLSQNVSKMAKLLGNKTVVVPAGESVRVQLELQAADSLREQLLADCPNGGFLEGFVSLSESVPACDGGESCPSAKMTDVPGPGDWSHAGIDFALRNRLFSGTSATTFSPGAPMTRAMLVTVLYAHAGKPTPQGSNPFRDVPADAFFTKAVTWASENKIVSGVGDGNFNPDGNITREQLAAILLRYAGFCGVDTSVRAQLDAYPDLDAVSPYALKAMSWAVGVGVLSGTTQADGTKCLDPQGNATRAQVATMLMSFIRNCLEPAALSGELHAAFTAFVGDWTKAPVMESHDWREILAEADFELNTDVNAAYAVCGNGDQAGETAVCFLGDNPYADTEFLEDRAAISHSGDWNALWMRPMLLRSARHLIMTAADAESGALYAVDDAEYLPKAAWDADSGLWQAAGSFRFDGTDLNGEPLPGGTSVRISFYANPDYGEDRLGQIPYESLASEGSEFLCWSFTLRIDDAAPELDGLRYDPAGRSLCFELSDDQYLALAELTPLAIHNGDDDVEFDPIWTELFADEAPGQSHSIALDDVQRGEYRLTVSDYAGNTTRIHLSLGGSPKLCELHFVCPEGGKPEEIDRFYCSEGGTLTMPWLTSDQLPWGGFAGWLPEPLEELWSMEALEEAALAEEILYPPQTAEICGESWYYALLRLPMEYGDPEQSVELLRENLPDFSGVWAIGAYWEPGAETGCFLDSAGGTASETVSLPEDRVVLEAPEQTLLFTVEQSPSGAYQIRNSEDAYLTLLDGDLAFADDPDACAEWLLRYDRRDGRMRILNAGTPEPLYLSFDRFAGSFCLVPAEELDWQTHCVWLYGPPVLSYGYRTP